MYFSQRQQQVLGMLCLFYGLWLIWVAYSDEQNMVDSARLAESEPPAMPFYIDPPVDLNSADAEELQLLPGIGPVLAKRIIAYRKRYGMFRSLRSLQNIYGIGPKTIQKLHYYLIFKKKSEIRGSKSETNSKH